MVKRCNECQEIKPLEEFYVSPGMKDGHLNQCKACFLENGRAFRQTAAGKAIKRRYIQSDKGRLATAGQKQRHSVRYPEKIKARNASRYLGPAQPCEVCGQPGQRHHPDYSKPLEVEWLCLKHHRERERNICA